MATDMLTVELQIHSLASAEVRPGSGVLTREHFLQAIALLSTPRRLEPTPLIVPPTGALLFEPCPVRNQALRVYARHYNARHPGRRIAYRRLTPAQFMAASEMFVTGQYVEPRDHATR